ncbi:uncharacterized protein LOC123518747 [Portunus trituberculatus]|uniref:uncharacterized protein LOC123518747 n=1 Tax=Portunus trituberculatus TaxID=210409 RepID=UPI001E1CB1B8|nr:uncharacterized protein LOC123518747 [Portunus trituberculatus]
MTITGFIVKPVIQMGNRKKRITAVVTDELPQTIVTTELSDVVHKLTKKGIQLADPIVENDKVGPIDILVGCDHYYDFISTNPKIIDDKHLLNTPAGYIVTGKIPCTYNRTTTNVSSDTVQESVIVMKITSSFDPLMVSETQIDIPPVHKLWELDVIGIDPSQSSPDDQISYKEYLKTVQYEDNQYWVKLPWKVNKLELPTNYRRACGQMYSLIKELDRKGLIQKYSDIIQEQVQLQFIEEVLLAHPTDKSHYLPHHGVMKDSTITPLRIVYNCSSKAHPTEPSLNECLMTGPSLTRKLGDVLLKFRTSRYAFTADISKAFLRIGLQEKDRDFTRFLWLSDPHNIESSMKTYRFKSVLFGATSSPFFLQATIDYHLSNSNSPMKELLSSNFYVDNFQGTTQDQDQLLTIYNEANKEIKLANMPLRQWTTNNSCLQNLIKTDFPGYNIPIETSVLGLQWNISNDTLRLKPVKPNIHHNSLTKRSLVANVSKLYDLLGFFSPVSIKGKLLIQDLGD